MREIMSDFSMCSRSAAWGQALSEVKDDMADSMVMNDCFPVMWFEFKLPVVTS